MSDDSISKLMDKIMARLKEEGFALKTDLPKSEMSKPEYDHVIANEENLSKLLSCNCGDPSCPFCNTRTNIEKGGLIKGTLSGLLLGDKKK